MDERLLDRARAGDEAAFRALTEPYRRELQVHCYRILGSVQDAEDLVQETLLAAWRGLGGFEGRASFRAWLYRIATNRCLNVLRDAGRRPQTVPASEPTRPAPTHWAEPTRLRPHPPPGPRPGGPPGGGGSRPPPGSWGGSPPIPRPAPRRSTRPARPCR